MSSDRPVRIAVDIGGTFTDIQIHNGRNGRISAFKTPSTPEDPSVGLIQGLNGAAERHGFALQDVGLIMHGSTIATNAVLERKLPQGALVTTAGFADVLEIGRHMRKNVYALKAEDRGLLIPRQSRFEVRERIRADGSIEASLDETALLTLIEHLKGRDIKAIAIAFLHSYRNSENERRAATLLAQHLPDVSVTASHEVSPEIREYERTSTTVLNALLKPVISNYLARVEARLQTAGIAAPLYMVQSNGGVATPEEAARMPVKLLLSGPAGGAMAMESVARHYGIANLVGLDMGGTSSDISVVIDGQLGTTVESEIDGLPVRLPMIEIRTIGAGGGSIARDEAGALRVGPESAGANPGPACYDRGGTQPTVTDANAALGRLAAASFMGGAMRIDPVLAEMAIGTRVAEPLGLGWEAAAGGITDVANTHMAGAIRLSLFEKGADPSDFALVPFGGAAGLHACAVADELDISSIVFPADASTLSARGILMADLRRDLSRSDLMMANADNLKRISTTIAELETEARRLLAETGLPEDRRELRFAADLRYRGQAYEITTPWDGVGAAKDIDSAAVERLVQAFHELHRMRYSHSAPEDPVELVTFRAIATGILERGTIAEPAADAQAATAGGTRSVYVEDGWQDVPTWSRAALIAASAEGAAPVEGPAIIEEEYTAILVAPGWQVAPAANGDLIATRLEEQ
jgi:N-methylhydantoinase A